MPIQRVSIPSIAIETNKNDINLERHLKRNLRNIPNVLNNHWNPNKKQKLACLEQKGRRTALNDCGLDYTLHLVSFVAVKELA